MHMHNMHATFNFRHVSWVREWKKAYSYLDIVNIQYWYAPASGRGRQSTRLIRPKFEIQISFRVEANPFAVCPWAVLPQSTSFVIFQHYIQNRSSTFNSSGPQLRRWWQCHLHVCIELVVYAYAYTPSWFAVYGSLSQRPYPQLLTRTVTPANGLIWGLTSRNSKIPSIKVASFRSTTFSPKKKLFRCWMTWIVSKRMDPFNDRDLAILSRERNKILDPRIAIRV